MRKYFKINLFLISLLFNIVIPYFQKFDFLTGEKNIVLGFPIRFFTIRKH